MAMVDKRPLEDMESVSQSKKRPKNMAHFRILFPGMAAGRIIGKKGENIKNIREKCQSGAYIRVPESPNAPERILMISCDMSDIKQIINQLAPKIFEGLPADIKENELCLLVPADQAGIVLGKGGNTIARIREESGAKGKLYKDKLPLCDERVLLLQGDLDCMIAAIIMIVGMLMENPLNHQCIHYAPHTVSLSDYPENCGGYVRHADAAKKDTALIYGSYSTTQFTGYTGYDTYNTFNTSFTDQDKVYNSSSNNEMWGSADTQSYSTPLTQDYATSASNQMAMQGYTPAAQLYDRNYTDNYGARDSIKTEPTGHDGHDTFGSVSGDFMDEEIMKEIKIPNKLTGSIIGPKGATIANIRKSTPAIIKIGDDDSVVNDQRNIMIKGSMRNVMQAYQLLKQLIVEASNRTEHNRQDMPVSDSELLQRIRQQFPYQECLDESQSPQKKEITIDNHHTGCVIGARGATIAEIRRVSKCRVIIANDSEVNGANERLITLTGTAKSINMAQYMLQAVIQMGN